MKFRYLEIELIQIFIGTKELLSVKYTSIIEPVDKLNF
jgi:hypothetical protein